MLPSCQRFVRVTGTEHCTNGFLLLRFSLPQPPHLRDSNLGDVLGYRWGITNQGCYALWVLDEQPDATLSTHESPKQEGWLEIGMRLKAGTLGAEAPIKLA